MAKSLSNKERVLLAVSRIPEGKVVTYGLLAELAGVKNPRVVGNILHGNEDPATYPCHRVVNRLGDMAPAYAFGGADEQARRLTQEGIVVENGHVDLARYLWHPTRRVRALFAVSVY